MTLKVGDHVIEAYGDKRTGRVVKLLASHPDGLMVRWDAPEFPRAALLHESDLRRI